MKTPNSKLTQEQISLIVERASSNSRDQLILELLSSCGLTVGELTSLKTKDINFQESTLTIPSTPRTLSLSSPLLEKLCSFTSKRRHLFKGYGGSLTPRRVQHIIKKYSEEAGFSNITSRTLRYSFALHFLKKTDDIQMLQRVLGLKSFSSIANYLPYNGESTEIYTKGD
ncbi:MAG: site-specific integrase [Candidatus Micrarchaeota archaeon]